MLKNNNEIVGNEDLSSDNASKADFAIGQDIQVIPTGFKEYGVFCDCGNGYSGLLHISRITPKFVKNVNDYFTIGKSFTARIIEVHNDAKKLSLSTKEFDLEVKRQDEDRDGFKSLESNLNSWVKKDSNN